MKVKLLQVGKGVKSVEVSLGASVRDALRQIGVDNPNGMLSVDGRQVDGNYRLSDGETITINPKVQGG